MTALRRRHLAALVLPARRRRHLPTLVLLGPPLAFLVLVFAVPLARAIWGSVFAPDLTWEYYARIWQVPVYGRVFWITLEISALTTLFCLLLGYPAAYFLASVRPRTRQVFLLCVIVPFFLSVLVRNYVWMVLLQRTGLVNRLLADWGLISRPLDLMYNKLGVLIAMVNMLLPYMIFPVLSALLAIPPELGHASASLGGGGARTFLRITLPLSLPGVAAGSLLVFIVALGFFITPALLGGPKQMMISNLIDFSVRQVLNWPFAFALATTLLGGTLVLYFVYVRLLEGRMPRAGFP
jgi:ABC-type spermidine/putrescine transport system permease subunit I